VNHTLLSLHHCGRRFEGSINRDTPVLQKWIEHYEGAESLSPWKQNREPISFHSIDILGNFYTGMSD
jgi:hypothetical protein